MTYLQSSKDYEDGLINAILSFPEDHHKIFNRLDFKHFSTNLNKKSFAVLKSIYEQNKPTALSNTAMVSELCGLLANEEVDWRWWAKHIQQDAPIPADIEFYISRIIRGYNKRRILEITNAAEKRIEKGDRGEDVVQYTKNELDNLDQETKDGGPINFHDVAVECIENLESPDTQLGIQTGYNDFDNKTLGLRCGDLVVIAGRPSMGKTTLATNICINAARNGYTGLIFSLEMSQYRLGLRILASETGCDLGQLSRGIVDDWHSLCEVGGGLQNLYIDFSTGLSHNEVIGRIKEFADSSHIDFVMLDYLQKMRFAGSDRHDIKVGNATGEFKNIAKELNIPFILISQLSRANEKDGRTVRMPRISDLKDSGAIEQDADIVAIIHRQEVYSPDDIEYKNMAEIMIAKNRDGATGPFNLTFRKNINRFENYEDPVVESQYHGHE